MRKWWPPVRWRPWPIGNSAAPLPAHSADFAITKDFVTAVGVSLPVIDQVLWRHLDLSYDEQGVPTLVDFDFDAACANRELRNATWEIYDLFWDWQGATGRAAEQLDGFVVRLNEHLVTRGVSGP